MGTHISKVKSVDLDVWTPEQMAVGTLHGPTETCMKADHSVLCRVVCSEMGQPFGELVLGGTLEARTCPTRPVRLAL